MAFTAETTVGLLARLAIEVPERVAFSTGLSTDRASRLTFSELWDQVQSLASSLAALGVRRGDRVAIRLPNSIEWVLWEHAAQALAAVPVGIGVQWSSEQVGEVLQSCGATVLVVETPAALHGIAAACLERCRVLSVLEPATAEPPSHPVVAHAELLGRSRSATVLAECKAADPATIIYTSGSTGKPKGIMHTHARVMTTVAALADYFPELEGGRLALGWMPMEHLFQRIFNLVSLAFALETRMVRDATKLIAMLCDLRPSYFIGVPFVYEQLLHAIERSPSDFAAWKRELRLMVIGSAPTSTELLERLAALGLPVLQGYSTSECLVPIAGNSLSANRLGSVGRPHPSYALRLSDAGEICVRGPGVFDGYYGDEQRAAFDADGYFRTGDIGYLDQDGYLYVGGRRDDFFKTSTGRKVSPLEVESAYKRSPLIEHIIVVGQGRKHLAALVQLEQGAAQALADRLGLPGGDPATSPREHWSNDERMKAAVLEEMREHESGLDRYKRVRGIVLLPRPLAVESGELTSTLKLRRDVVIKRYAVLLDALFTTLEARTGDHEA